MNDMIWDYRSDAGRDTASSIIDYEVHATDGSIGTVTEESVAVGSGYIVVDAGFWIFDMKRLIPAGAIERVDHEKKQVILGMTKDNIRDAPDYVKESRTVEEEDAYIESIVPFYQPWVVR